MAFFDIGIPEQLQIRKGVRDLFLGIDALFSVKPGARPELEAYSKATAAGEASPAIGPAVHRDEKLIKLLSDTISKLMAMLVEAKTLKPPPHHIVQKGRQLLAMLEQQVRCHTCFR